MIIFLFGCSGVNNNGKKVSKVYCPNVYFSTESNIFIDKQAENVEYEQINYKASLDNFGFLDTCLSESDNNKYPLDLLIIVKPINPQNELINFPIFVFLYDEEENLIDRQYFRIKGKLKYNKQELYYEDTELVKKINIFSEPDANVNSLVIGFVTIK